MHTLNNLDVSDIKPEDLLAALYNAVSPSGMGFLQARPGDMTPEQASALLNGDEQESDYPIDRCRKKGKPAYFDYLYGRCLKVEINGKTLRTGLYDRDYGQGAAQRVVDSVRSRRAA